MNLTENEAQALALTLNYESRESQHSDNFSNAGVEELCKHFGWNAHQVGGLISSLSQKGLAYHDHEDVDLLWLSPQGVDAIFDYMEANGNPLES